MCTLSTHTFHLCCSSENDKGDDVWLFSNNRALTLHCPPHICIVNTNQTIQMQNTTIMTPTPTPTKLTKSDYLRYRDCPSSLWFHKNAPHLLAAEKEDPFVDRLKGQGYKVELCARQLYPQAILVTGKPEQAAAKTQALIASGAQQLFQASFMVDGLFASCDILLYNDLLGAWDIIEVKSSTSTVKKKAEHIYDVAFQRLVAQSAGLRIANVYLLELNKEYTLYGEPDLAQLFQQSEITTECINREAQVKLEAETALSLLGQPQPTDCSCKYKGRSRHCRAFSYLYPEVPAYSVYDLQAIGRSKVKLKKLIDEGCLKLTDIPSDFKLSPKHAKQVDVARNASTILKEAVIAKQFEELEYPLYFLDYETLACGIPVYQETYPYQQAVFQYSLHILQEDGSIEHKEYIHKDPSTPVHIVADKLREDIGDVGSVIVWNQTFESKCNSDLAKVNCHLSDFLEGLNTRIFDLMKIFQRMEYLVDAFKGKYSIKNILPVMCPDLDYSALEVSNGGEAVVVYEELIFGNKPEYLKAEKFEDLLAYCKLDTWAMVRIFQELEALVVVASSSQLQSVV